MADINDSHKGQKAAELFRSGYNCSQAVLVAWHEELGISPLTAAAVSAGFGGGMGRMREVCGACSGAFMALGLRYGGYSPKDYAAKKRMYETIQRFASRFKEENGTDTIICRELLGLSGREFSPVPTPRTEDFYKKRPCPELIGMASALLEEFITEE